MATPRELPDQARDFIDLSKQYLSEEVVEPTKRLGAFAGKGIGAGFLFALGGLLLASGVLSLLLAVLPDDDVWQALAHVGAGLVAAAASGILFWKVAN